MVLLLPFFRLSQACSFVHPPSIQFNLLAARQPAAISFLSLSGTGLTCTNVILCEQLRKLSVLQHLDLSSNDALDNGAVSRIITELAGAVGARCILQASTVCSYLNLILFTRWSGSN